MRVFTLCFCPLRAQDKRRWIMLNRFLLGKLICVCYVEIHLRDSSAGYLCYGVRVTTRSRSTWRANIRSLFLALFLLYTWYLVTFCRIVAILVCSCLQPVSPIFSLPRCVLKVNDTIKIDLESGKPIETIKFEIGNVCMIARGRNAGRVGIMQHIER